MNQFEQSPGPFAELLREATRLSDDEKLVARSAFLERVDAEKKVSKVRQLKVWIAPAALAAAAVLIAFVAWPTADLGYQVTGAVSEGGYIRAASSESARLDFTDKTQVTADPQTRLRVVETREHGASILLEQGSLHVAVTHKEQTAWQFAAGPFKVNVTGTRFDLSWDAEHERLIVVLQEGSVNIEGYAGSGPVQVRAGQRFLGDARSRTMQVHDTQTRGKESIPDSAPRLDHQKTAPESDVSAADALPSAIDNSSVAQKPSHASNEKEAWSHLVARGDFKRVVSEANQLGIPSCISNCSAQDLNALADAARYTGQTDLAEKSLLALRRRFTSSAGNRAAFLLGRLYEGQGKTGKALDWYDTALKQSPSGPFAPESLAGKMRTVSAVQGKGAAAPIAREYLQRYPGGVHAAAARQLAQVP